MFNIGEFRWINRWIFSGYDIYCRASNFNWAWILFFCIGTTIAGSGGYFSTWPLWTTSGYVQWIEWKVQKVEWVSDESVHIPFFSISKMLQILTVQCVLWRKLKNLTHFTLRGHELSPVKHLYLKVATLERPEKVELLEKFVDKVNDTRQFWWLFSCWFIVFTFFCSFYSVSHKNWPLQMQPIWIGWKRHAPSRVYVLFAIAF